MVASALDPRTKSLVGNRHHCNEIKRLNVCSDFIDHFPSGKPSAEDDRDQVWLTLEKLLIDHWIADFTWLSQEQAYVAQPAAHVQLPTDFDPWGKTMKIEFHEDLHPST